MSKSEEYSGAELLAWAELATDLPNSLRDIGPPQSAGAIRPQALEADLSHRKEKDAL